MRLSTFELFCPCFRPYSLASWSPLESSKLSSTLILLINLSAQSCINRFTSILKFQLTSFPFTPLPLNDTKLAALTNQPNTFTLLHVKLVALTNQPNTFTPLYVKLVALTN